MLKRIYLSIILCAFSGVAVMAQSGAIKGKVVDKTSGEALPFASVVAELNGSQAGVAQTDFDGNFTIKPLTPGKYDLKATFVGYTNISVTGVLVANDKITFQDLKLSKGVDIKVVEVVEYTVPLIDKGNPSTQKTLTSDEIEVAPTRDVKSLAATSAGVVQKDEGDDVNVRGSRTNATDYYVDGVKVRGTARIPQAGIEQINIVTGGTEAQYGDNTGGIISITTKGPSKDFGFGLEYVTSEIFDKYGYNLIAADFSGPILFKKDQNGVKNRPILGFAVSGEYQLEKDPDPSALGIYKVNDTKWNELIASPLTPNATAGYNLSSDYLRAGDLEKVKAKQNIESKAYRFVGKLNFQPMDKITFTVGGNYDKSDGHVFDWTRALLDYDHNENRVDVNWNAFARFTQRFGSNESKDKAASTIKNAYYTLQFDISKFTRTRQDDLHQDRLFDYGYLGKFTQTKVPVFIADVDTSTGQPFWTQAAYGDVNYTFEPGNVNPVLENYTSQYFDIAENNVLNASEVLQNNSLINGSTPNATYAMWRSVGTQFNLFQDQDNTQYHVSASGSADFKNHNIMIGFEFEQRVERLYGINPVGLWGLMRSYANLYNTNLDLANPITVNDTTFYNRLYSHKILIDDPNNPGQQISVDAPHNFYENVRDKLGLSYTDYVDIDSYDRSNYSLSLFTADDLNASGQGLIGYWGYTYDGKPSSEKVTFSDYFKNKDANGNYTRKIDAFRPIYTAGYIQDRFAFNDLIFNVGVRVDRFDANQKVLNDKYLLFAAKTAGELNITDRPANIGDDYVVYVNNVKDPNEAGIVGYRNGDTWYDATGAEIADPKVLADAAGGKIAPYLVDKTLATNGVQSEAFDPNSSFKDYDPQITVMPRVAFQFPISDEAEFIAHYDVLTQRPPDRLRNDPSSFYFIESQGAILNNPDLKPEKTTDYEIGFKQKVSSSSAFSISAFYRELRNMIQITNVTYAFPVTYSTYGNIDFGTVKGLVFSYDLRRTGNVRMNLSYTLQFADGTGSGDQSANKLIQLGQPNLRNLTPLDFDQRHILVASVDYRYGSGKDYNGPMLFGSQILSNTGINFIFKVNSGTPYTRQSDVITEAASLGVQQVSSGIVKGTVNGARLPWQYKVDVKLDKDFEIKFGGDADKKKSAFVNVYIQVQNLFNTKNIISVYRYTGNPDDDGYLASSLGQQDVARQNDPLSYTDLYNIKVNNPENYSIPRRIRLGVKLDF